MATIEDLIDFVGGIIMLAGMVIITVWTFVGVVINNPGESPLDNLIVVLGNLIIMLGWLDIMVNHTLLQFMPRSFYNPHRRIIQAKVQLSS